MSHRKIILVPMLILACLSLNSCLLLLGAAAVGAGAGTVAYVDGKYTMNMNGNMKEVYNAAVKTVKHNDNFVISEQALSNKKGLIKGSTKINDTSFTIEVEKITDNASKVSVRIGTFGDQEVSANLMNEIQKNTKTGW